MSRLSDGLCPRHGGNRCTRNGINVIVRKKVVGHMLTHELTRKIGLFHLLPEGRGFSVIQKHDLMNHGIIHVAYMIDKRTHR